MQLMIVALIPIILSVVLYCVKKREGFRKLPYMARQTIIGVLFGIAAVCSTIFGVDVGGATANVRDAAPLCAGLLFGAPAGIIAGAIGGIHRWFATYFGAGEYSQIACSVSTFLAGLYAAVLRKYMFEDRRVSWNMGALIAVVMEVVHLIILFLTHLNDAQQAFTIVKIVTVPMIAANALAVGFSAGVLELLHSLVYKGKLMRATLAQRIQQWLLLAVFAAYLVTTMFVYVLQSSTAAYEAKSLLETNLEDLRKDIKVDADYDMLSKTKLLTMQYMTEGSDNSRLSEYAGQYGFQEINIVDTNGIITHSTNPEFVGFDMNSGEQSREFLILNRYVLGSYVQDFGSISFNEEDLSKRRKYAGVVLQTGGFLQTGYDYDGYQESLMDILEGLAQNRRIGQSGYILIADAKGRIISDYGDHQSKNLKEAGIEMSSLKEGTVFEAVVYETECCCMYTESEGFLIIGALPKAEIYDTRDTNVYVNSFMQVITFALLFAIIFFLVKVIVVDDIHSINEGLSRIIAGKLDERVDVSSAKELEDLSGYINETVVTLNRYIAEAAERIRKDLDLAKDIQHSALPNNFPPYPEISEFDIYATMNTAKEVGGDFYDFFMVGINKLAFVVADVSGKGIPAAMFMMRAKTLIKTQAETGKDAASVIFEANNSLCQNNDAGMFVTAWFGILDFSTGHVVFVNAGHNPPLIGRKGEGYSYLKSKAGLVLAGMEGVPYRTQEFDLNPGDRLFLYTDGVTEATSTDTELYGEERLQKYLNEHQTDDIHLIPGGVKQDMDIFIKGAEQFDDITMLVLEYKGPEGEKK